MPSQKRKAFVFTGISFLLVIPAIMLAASFAGMVRYGEAGKEIALKSDVVYYITKDLKETTTEILKKSGRWETHQATKLIIDTYANLTRTTDINYAKAHSFFPDTEVDPQGRNITAYLQDKIIETMKPIKYFFLYFAILIFSAKSFRKIAILRAKNGVTGTNHRVAGFPTLRI